VLLFVDKKLSYKRSSIMRRMMWESGGGIREVWREGVGREGGVFKQRRSR